MPTKKQPPEPPWQVILERIESQNRRFDAHQVILEDMRSQNRATIEAVEATHQALEERIGRLQRETRQRDAMLEMAVRELRINVQQNGADIGQLLGDVHGLTAKVEAIARIEERVAALEKRLP
jgi:hypothetical protein